MGEHSEPTVSLQMMKFLFVSLYNCDGGHFPYIQIIRTSIGYINSNYNNNYWLHLMSEPQDVLHHSSIQYIQLHCYHFVSWCRFSMALQVAQAALYGDVLAEEAS